MFYMEDKESVQLEDLLPSCVIKEIETSSSQDESKDELNSEKEEINNCLTNSIVHSKDLFPSIVKNNSDYTLSDAYKQHNSETIPLPSIYNKPSLIACEDDNETITSSPKSRLLESNNTNSVKYSHSDAYYCNYSLNIPTDEMTNYLFYSLRPLPKKILSDNRLAKFDSQVLYEDKSTIKDILNNFPCNLHEFIKTQKGSKILQNELSSISMENLELLLNKIHPYLSELMIDTYGNYFCQKLIKTSKVNHRIKILESIYNDFSKISKNNSGTHSIQCLIEILSSNEEEEMVKKCIEKDIINLSYVKIKITKDINSTHVVQKIIGILKEDRREKINNILFKNLKGLVLDQNGICVIKKLVSKNTDLAFRRDILYKLTEDCIEIIQNPFGNYIIQYILDLWGAESCSNILQVIGQNILTLSMQKYSSNVVEKCFDLISPIRRNSWIDQVFNFNKIMCLIKNKYGNYVLQKAVQMMSFSERSERKLYLSDHLMNFHKKDKTRIRDFINVI